MNEAGETRINKFLAERGVASRRAIDARIREGRVSINGTVVKTPGMKVCDTDVIAVNGKIISHCRQNRITLLLNKPKGCISTHSDTHGRRTVFDYIPRNIRLFSIGRLDKDTTGVLLFTNDGDLAHCLMHPRKEVEKVYCASLDAPLSEKDKHTLEKGILLDGKMTAPCTVQFFQKSKNDVRVAIHEGRNRQIHRMFNALGYVVCALERISYAGLDTQGLTCGEWRYCTQREIENLKKYCAERTKTSAK